MPFVSVTRLRIRSALFAPRFMVYALRSARQAEKSPGFLGGALMRDRAKAFWTVTVWSDAKAMESYRTAGVHRAAMPKLLHWCDEASVTHWTQDSGEIPDWQEAYRRLVSEGRTSKVYHPSAAHEAFQIPELRPTRFATDLRPRQ